MFAKKTGEVPPRVEKFIMDLQEYDFIVEYQSGKTMIADFMSRNHGERTGSSPVKANEKLVRNIVESEVVHVINYSSAILMHGVKDTIAQCPLSQKMSS